MFPLAATAVSARGFVALYGIQTAGAAAGVCLGTFYLPYTIGRDATAAVAFAVNLLSLKFLFGFLPDERSLDEVPSGPKPSRRHDAIAFACGFLALLLQVLFIRFIAIGSDDSIYAFGAASLVVVTLLTVASVVTSRLPASLFRSHDALHVVMLLSLSGVIAAVAAFASATHELRIGPIEVGGFSGALALAVPVVGLGYFFPSFILPFVLRFSRETSGGTAAPTDVGRLLLLNGVGCAAGAVTTSFVLLPHLGMWSTALVAMVGYVLITLLLARLKPRLAAAALSGVVILLVNPTDRPLSTPTDPYKPDRAPTGRVVATLEGAYGIVTVADYPDRRTLWLNNNFQLEAGLSNVQGTQRMGILPTLLAPSAERVMMIGIGTGISASGFLAAPVSRIDLVELIPEVREAAARYFDRYNLDVLSEPRVHVHVADGRQFLRMSSATWDVIVSDVFTPWNEGTAYLYTREHFLAVRRRLAQGGVFVLWLPLYQLTERELYAIARTHASVFPDATLWQLEISTDMSVLGLVAGAPFDVDALAEGLSHRVYPRRRVDIVEMHPSGIFCRYVAPSAALEPAWASAPFITADRPVLERMAAEAGRSTLTERRFLAFVEPLYGSPANPGGRIFRRWDETLEAWRQTGLLLNRYWYEDRHGDPARARAIMAEIQEKNPATKMASGGP
jgi:spermidine synthase